MERGVRDIGVELADYSRSVVGDALRFVTRYGQGEHEPIYTRPGLLDALDLDEETRAMFRFPLLQLHRGFWRLTTSAPALDTPKVGIYCFDGVTVLQFPIGEEEGIIVSVDMEGIVPRELIAGCESIVSEAGR